MVELEVGEVVEVVENQFLRKLFSNTRVSRGSYTQNPNLNYFHYFETKILGGI